MIKRLFKHRRVRRVVCGGFIAGGVALVLSGVATGVFLIAAHRALPDFQPVTSATRSSAWEARVDSIAGYRRAEDATYLTYVEWYLVFNPQDYGRVLTTDRASRFAYFGSISQIWSSYAKVYGIANRHYDFNGGYNLMLVVISTSSTVELVIKGAYENTVGRFFEWTASGRTPEDDYAARIARDYGAFIPTRPWFEYPFGQAFTDLWSTHEYFGPNFLRKTERKFWLSLEYGVKTIYAAVIRAASHSVYGVADTEVHLSASHVTEPSLEREGVRTVQALGDGHWILTVPHYQGFTDTVPLLARDGVEFDEIAGNDEILLSLVAPQTWTYDLPAGRPLFALPVLSGEANQRIAVQVSVRELSVVLRAIETRKLHLEHLFDY